MICPNINGQQPSNSVSSAQRQPANYQVQTQGTFSSTPQGGHAKDVTNAHSNNYHKVMSSTQENGQTMAPKTALTVQSQGFSTMLQTAQILVRGPDGMNHMVGVIFDSASDRTYVDLNLGVLDLARQVCI